MGISVELAQIRVRPGDIEGNLNKHISLIQSSNADCIVFPELSLIGYTSRDIFFTSTTKVRLAVEKISNVIEKLGKCAIVGLPRETRKGILRNSAVVLRSGKSPLFVDKLYLANYELFDEKRYFQEGNHRNLRVFAFKGEKIGTVVCEDAWHPEPIELLARKGADIVVVISASPFRISGSDIRESWRALLSAHSIMNTVWTVFVNSVGQGEEEYFWGGSMVSSPSGKIVMKLKEMEEDRGVVTIDSEENRRARVHSGFKDHRRELHRDLYSY